jgi:O-antigen/teichoic acid export membrane protein
MAAGIALSLVYTPFMLRLLGQSEWGLYSLVASVVGYLHLLSFGFGGAYVRFYSRAAASDQEGEIARVNGLFMVVFSAMSVVTILAGIVLTTNAGVVLGDKLSPSEVATARVLMGLMTFTVALSFPASVFSSFVTVNERFVFQRLLQLARTVATPVVTLMVLLLGYKSIGMAVVAAVIAVAATVVNVAYCLSKIHMSFSFRGLDLKLMKEISVFSAYIFINMIVDQANWHVDKFILGRAGGTVAVAVYAVAAQLSGYYMSLSTTVSAVFVPRVNRLAAVLNDDRELTRLLTRVGRVQFLILGLVLSALIVFGDAFISMWAGADYKGAYLIALILIIPVTIPLTQTLGVEIQRAKNMHQFRSWLYLGIAVLNVAVSIPLAQRYGGVGAAVGTGAALLLGNGLIMNLYYHRRVGLDMRVFWKGILGFVPGLVPVVIAGAAVMYFVDVDGAVRLLAWGSAYVTVYCASMWLLGMNDYERDLIGRPVARLWGRWRLSAR